MTSERILEPGRNCWRIERADQVAFLVDGEAYFAAARNAFEQAREAIYILGWDIDSRVRLVRNGEQDGYPQRLGDFLNELVQRRRHLHIYVLVWDFAMIYALEREWLPIYKLGWQTHGRLHFRMDAKHPTGASQHQKVVVIDDAAAFVGGMDLSKWRWDTPAHRPLDPRRSGPEGHLYPPYHDVQMLVTGPAAAALGDLARERWRRVTRERLGPARRRLPIWPDGVRPDMENIALGIARTFPRYNGYDEVREVEHLYADSIRAARQFIYLENQYFTSTHIAELLAERLDEPNGPEVVVVLPKRSNGWLEQHTMDVLRTRALAILHAADRHRRLAVYYPDHPDVQPDYINVHDKVMVMDDTLLRVGSANLSNRSMGLDSECDLAMEAGDDPLMKAQIASFRNRLLAEHLETTPEAVADALHREGSLIRAIGGLRQPGRTLLEFGVTPPLVPDWASDAQLIDTERPIAAAELVDHFVAEEQRATIRRHLARNITLLALLFILAATWRLTPVGEYLEPDRLLGYIDFFRALPAAPLITIGAYVIGGLLVVPVTLMVVITVLAFGPTAGFAYSLIGSLLSACVSYGVGHWLGRDLVRRFAGARINRLSQRLAARGILAVAVIRFLPIAPFTVVNIVAGASHLRFRDFALGTVIGMAPGLLAMAVFIDRVAASVRDPAATNFAWLAAIAVVIALAAYALRRLLRQQTNRTSPDTGGDRQ